jgi:uncharacterized protein (TIGR02231 family)
MPPVTTSIEGVTVYLDRARVRRSGKVAVEAGEQELLIEHLPDELLPESIRASARASVPVKLLSTDVARTFHKEPVEARVADLQARIEGLTDQDTALDKQSDALTTRRVFLQTLASSAGEQLARGLALGRVDVSAGATIGTFLSEQLTVVDTELLEVARRKRELGKELAAARSQLQTLQRRQATQRFTASIRVEASAGGEVEVWLSYQVTGAEWQPLYDLRLTETPAGPRLALASLAQVTQRTGESWDRVALSLSTARPALTAVLPELHPWFLELYAPPPPVGAAYVRRQAVAAPAAPAMLAAAVVDEDLEAAVDFMGLPAEAVEPVVEESAGTVTFHVPGGTDIPNDGSPHKVSLGDHDLPAGLDFVTAPKVASHAYRRARIINTTASVLLPGSAQIFHEDEYVGSTPIKAVAPGGELKLFLGVDDGIEVERKLVEGTVDKKLLVDVRRRTYAYEIRVKNLTPAPASITVLDQLPLSHHESVKVRKGEIRPVPAEETELGRLRWELTLSPGAEQKIRFGFTIEAPRDRHVVGLPPVTAGG